MALERNTSFDVRLSWIAYETDGNTRTLHNPDALATAMEKANDKGIFKKNFGFSINLGPLGFSWGVK